MVIAEQNRGDSERQRGEEGVGVERPMPEAQELAEARAAHQQHAPPEKFTVPLSLKSSESTSDERSEKRVGDDGDGDGDSDGDDGRSSSGNNFALINAVSASSAAKDTLCACDRWLRSRTCTSEEDLDDDEGGGGGGGENGGGRAPQMEKGAVWSVAATAAVVVVVPVAMTSPPSSKDGARDRRCVERRKVTVTDTEG